MQNKGLHISTSSLKGSVHILCKAMEGREGKGKGGEGKGRGGEGGR